ncbi:MAG: ABC transporter ATP-binding protein, partial [Peptococcaceae bacterium]|nr:ABC transporter ATP-binding protein [Peptococcaceae bacterium]
MISVFKKIWLFAGAEQENIKKSIGLGLLNAIFHALQLYAIFVVLGALVQGNVGTNTAAWAVGLMLASIVGKIITQYYSQLQRVHAGYFMAAEKRIQIGDKLKIVPMGYFNQNSLGNITAVATTTLSAVETTAPVVLVTTLGGFINATVFAIVILLFDWRIGLLVACAMLLFLWVTALMEKRTRRNAPLRQAAQEGLVAAALETIQGMSVVKAFNLNRDENKRMAQAIDHSCQENA